MTPPSQHHDTTLSTACLKKIAVLGLGESLKLYDYVMNDYDCTIGVNDIWSKVKTDHVVCLDLPARFLPERLDTINACEPQRFYTHLAEWSDKRGFWPIELQHDYPNYVCQLDIPALPKSMCSPFVACVIAFKLHDARQIDVYGVDLINHPHLDQQTCAKILTHFRNLKQALAAHGCTLLIHGNGILKSL